MKDQCHRAVVFSSTVEYHTVVKANVEEGVKGETVALVMKDIHTQFRHVYPSQNKSTESCQCVQPLSFPQG